MDTSSTKKNTKRVAIVGGTVAALLGGGIAFAAWTSNGSGTGTATAGTDAGLSVAPASSTPDLVPNQSATMTVKVTNNNSFAIHLDALSLSAATGAITSDKTGCGDGALTVATTSYAADTAATVPALGNATFPVTVTMGNAASNTCQGATFTIKLDATGTSISGS